MEGLFKAFVDEREISEGDSILLSPKRNSPSRLAKNKTSRTTKDSCLEPATALEVQRHGDGRNEHEDEDDIREV